MLEKSNQNGAIDIQNEACKPSWRALGRILGRGGLRGRRPETKKQKLLLFQPPSWGRKSITIGPQTVTFLRSQFRMHWKSNSESNLMESATFWNNKNEHFAAEVLQKSNFGIDEYTKLIATDFGSILCGFGRSFGTKKLPKSMPRWYKKTNAILECLKKLNLENRRNARRWWEPLLRHFNARKKPLRARPPRWGRRIQTLRAFRRAVRSAVSVAFDRQWPRERRRMGSEVELKSKIRLNRVA